jgi:hypothetical protein
VTANGNISAIVRASACLPTEPTDYQYQPTELPECIKAVPLEFTHRLLDRDAANAAQEWLRPRVMYRDDSKPDRKCDWCGKWYRGPAVYCSLDCAELDA